MNVEEEAQAGREFIYLQPPLEAPVDVFEPVGEGEGDLLDCSGACLSDVVAADADWVPARKVLRGELYGVSHQPHGRRRRKDVFVLRRILLQDVVLESTAQGSRVDALFLRRHDVHGPDDCRGRVDGHGRGDLVQRDAVKEDLHIRQGRYGHATFAELPAAAGSSVS